jgi:hypothetical protein
MRFNEGHIRIWLEDISRLFSQSPHEFALFYWLLANCHYKDHIHWKTIKGRTHDKKNYSQEWGIKKGDFLGSKVEIKTFWKYDYRTQKKILTSLTEKGLIEILLEDPALIIRIKNYNLFAWRGKSKQRPEFPGPNEAPIELPTPSVELPTPSVELPTPSVILHAADIGDTTNLCGLEAKLPTKPSSSSSSSPKKGEGEEIARERAENPPLISTNFKKEPGEGNVIPIDSISSKNAVSDDLDSLSRDWLIRTKRRLPDSSYTLESMKLQIAYMLRTRSIEILRQILIWLEENPHEKISKEFISPWDRDRKFFGMTLLDAAHQEISPILEKKIEQKKKNDEAKEKQTRLMNIEIQKKQEEVRKWKEEQKAESLSSSDLREGKIS